MRNIYAKVQYRLFKLQRLQDEGEVGLKPAISWYEEILAGYDELWEQLHGEMEDD